MVDGLRDVPTGRFILPPSYVHVDDLGGDASAGEAAVVGAVVVVLEEVTVEFAPEAGVAGVEVAGEGWPPSWSIVLCSA